MSEWKEYKLGELTTKIGSGSTPRGGSNNYKNFGISLIRSQNILDFAFSPSGLAFIDDEQAEELKGVTIEENDILFNITGDSVARCCIVPPQYLPARVNQHVAIIRSNYLSEVKFIFYYLQFLKPELLISAEIGATRNAITKVMLENLEIKIPPLPEQKAIASVLSSLDDKIDMLHRQNATLEKMAETLFRQWFVEEAKEEEVELSEFADNIKVNANVKDLLKHKNYIGLEHIPRKSICLINWGNPDGLGSNKSVFQENDILFGKLRSYFHKVIFAPVSGICSTDILVIRPKNKAWFSFCLFWFSSEEVVNYSDLGSGGTRMPRTSWEIIKSYKIPKPSIEKIENFSLKVEPMINKIKSNQTQIRTLTAMRDNLLPKLMSGEVRVEIK